MKALAVALVLVSFTLLAPTAAAAPPGWEDLKDRLSGCTAIVTHPSEPTDYPFMVVNAPCVSLRASHRRPPGPCASPWRDTVHTPPSAASGPR